MTDLSEFLLSRRSVVVRNMREPGPDAAGLEKFCALACASPITDV